MGGTAALVCAISFALFMLAATVVALKLARTMSITNRMLDDIRRQVIPLMGKLQTTMDHVNTEMGYVDGVLAAAERLAERADSMTKAAQSIFTSPLVKIFTLGMGARKAFERPTESRREEGPRAAEEEP